MHCNLCKRSHAGNIKRKVNLEVWNVWGSQYVWCIFILRCEQCAVWKRVWLCARVSGVLPGMKYCPTMHSAFERICKCTKLYSINHKLHTHTNPVQESNDQIQLKASTALNGLWTFGNAKIDWMNVESFSEASGFKYFGLFVCVYTIFWQSNVLRTSLTL